MEALYITIGIAFMLAFAGLIIFLISLKHGQFEDIEAPKYRILFDDEKENSKCAFTVFQKQGFPAWTTYNNKFKNSSYCAN